MIHAWETLTNKQREMERTGIEYQNLKTERGQTRLANLDFRDLALLKIFIDGNHFLKVTGLLLKDINLDRSAHTIYNRLVRLQSQGYVGRGYRISNADTFYITQKGIDFYREAMK